jgi:hypothetical protein
MRSSRVSSVFSKRRREHSTRGRIDVHRLPRSRSSRSADRLRFIRRGSLGYGVGSLRCRIARRPLFAKCEEAARDVGRVYRATGRDELRDDFTAIGHKHRLAAPHLSDVLAQPVLQLAQADGPHSSNVASCSWIVNRRASRAHPAAPALRGESLYRLSLSDRAVAEPVPEVHHDPDRHPDHEPQPRRARQPRHQRKADEG